MAGLRFVLLALIAAPSLALAQPPPSAPTERVAVTGPASRQAIESFVASFATPTHMTGKIARWETGICPVMAGQKPNVSAFVTQHLKAIAVAVGAPVSAMQSCKPNIEIVFTATPQALLDNVRAHDADYVGYATSNEELRLLATVTRPVQAWYATETRDLRGMYSIDSGRARGQGSTALAPTYASVTGNRINDGLRSAFHHILIVVDPGKLAGQEIVPLADYIAMLALTQPGSLDSCRKLASIMNLLAPGCGGKPIAVTENDLAYLRGIYNMNADRLLLATQKSDIADRMVEALGKR